VGWEGVDRLIWVRITDTWRAVVKHGYEPSGFMKYGEFLEKLGNCQMRHKYSHAAPEREVSVRSDSSRDVPMTNRFCETGRK